MRQTTTSPNLPLDPVTTPRSRAVAPKTREPFLIPEHRPETPGARRASPAKPEASSFGQARAEARSAERGERREPTRGQGSDEPRSGDRPSDAAPRAGRPEPSRNGRPLREGGNETCDNITKCPEEAEESVAKAAPEAMPAIETAPEVASGNSSEFADPETDEASPATPELAEQAEAASHPAGLAMPTSLSERGNAAPTLEAETGSLTTTGRAQTGSPSGPALPETETSLQAALGAASETLTRGKPDSGGTSPHSVVPSTEPSPEPGPGPSRGGVRPEGLSSQALTQAADAAQDRGIQTALLATSSPDAAADSTRASPHAAPAVEKPHPVTPPMPLGAVAIEIGLKSLAGLNRFEIRLDPAELGRIDVQLEIGDDGEVKAHLTVDRVETLALLQRDARTLERAFEQAGLKPSEGGIDLTLRDQAGDPEGRGSRDGRRDDSVATPGHDGTDQRAESQNAAAAASRPLHWRNGIDVRV